MVRLTSLPRLLRPAVLLRSLLRLLPPVVLPKLLLLAVRLTSLLRPLPPVVRLTSRKKSLLPAVPPAVPATSNRGFPPKSVPGGKVLAGNLANHSVTPIYIQIPKDKVITI